MSRIRPWEVWYVDLGEPVGHEQGGRRPGVVVGSALHCRFPIRMAIFVPLTGTENLGGAIVTAGEAESGR